MKSFYIIIRGPLGIGKTTISRALAEEIDAEYISIDEVLEKNNLDKIEGECIPAKNFLKANKLIVPKAKKFLDNHKSLIFDGNFYHKEQIEDLIKNLKYKNYIFTLKASLKSCVERDKNRKSIYGEDATKAVYSIASKFDYGIEINTENKTIKEIVNEIKESLK